MSRYIIANRSDKTRNRVCPVIAILAGLAGCDNKTIGTSVHRNPDTGLLTWTAEAEGFRIGLIQLLPDFVRAIYESHHFPATEIERIARYCVFGTVVANTSQQQVRYRVADWYYVDSSGMEHPIKTKTQWIGEWRKAGINFSWTLLPDESVFETGDWQQGFTTIDTTRDSTFDLVYSWQTGRTKHTARLENIHCAPARLLQEQ